MPRPIDTHSRYNRGIDGLRTLAVLVVVLYHLTVPGFIGGLLGVGVFFTLSGYLITSNLMRSWDRRGILGLKTFWLRRFRRLIPAVILTLASVIILSAALRKHDLESTILEALSSLFYVNNWHVIFKNKSYFDNFSGPSPLSHMWSLSVEEQFYLLWPLVLLVLLVLLRNRTAALVGTLGITTASFILMWTMASQVGDNTRVYEGTDTRAGGLLLGAALAIWLSSRRHTGKPVVPNLRTADVMGSVGIAGIMLLVIFVPNESVFLYRGGILLLSISTILVIFSILHPHSSWSKILGWTPLRWVGERSYGIYLWHMPVIAFMPREWFEEHKLMAAAITAVLSLLLASLSWSLVEDPIRRNGIIEPLRQWQRARRAEREMGYQPGGTTTTTTAAKPFPAFIAAGSTVILVAIIAVAATPLVVHQPTNASMPRKMELDPQPQPPATPPQPVSSGLMSCQRVVHVGDSTSIGMFDSDQLPSPEDSAFTTYREYGAQDVIDSVFGARSTTEGWQNPKGGDPYPSAVESVKQLQQQVPAEGTCWVIATGVNDAANIAAGGAQTHLERIETMMDLLGPNADVLWPMVTTNTTTGYYARSNMELFNSALQQATNEYPRLRLYDWSHECNPQWFAADDFAHYGAKGNSERAHRFAAALARAFPRELQGQPTPEKIISSGL